MTTQDTTHDQLLDDLAHLREARQKAQSALAWFVRSARGEIVEVGLTHNGDEVDLDGDVFAPITDCSVMVDRAGDILEFPIGHDGEMRLDGRDAYSELLDTYHMGRDAALDLTAWVSYLLTDIAGYVALTGPDGAIQLNDSLPQLNDVQS